MLLASVLLILRATMSAAWAQPIECEGACRVAPLSSSPDASDSQAAHGLQDALTFEAGDGALRLEFGALIRVDGRTVGLGGRAPAVSDLDLHSARLTIDGLLLRRVAFRVAPDFAEGGALSDAYLDVPVLPSWRLRVGLHKTPMGLEILQRDAQAAFMERGLPSRLLPRRDVGVQAYGSVSGGAVTYAVGLFDGVADGADAPDREGDDHGSDLVARFTLSPFRGRASALQGLVVGAAASAGRSLGGLPSIKTTGRHTFFSYAPDASAAGRRTRLSPQLSYSYKSVDVLAEWVRSRQLVANADIRLPVTNEAWQVAAHLVVTGETVSAQLKPKRPFDPARGGWGALQLTARYGALRVDPLVFAGPLAGAASSRGVRETTVGANWYLTESVRAVLNFDRAALTGADGRRAISRTVLFRLQWRL